MKKEKPISLKEVLKKAIYFECWGINEESSKNKFWRINRKFTVNELEHPEVIDQILNRIFTDKYEIYAYEFFGKDDNERTISLGVFLARDIIYSMDCNCEICKRHRELQLRLITSEVTKETYDFFEELWTDYCNVDEDSDWYKAEFHEEAEEVKELKKLINEKDARIKKLTEENDYLRDFFRAPMDNKCIKNTVEEECEDTQLICPKCGNHGMFGVDVIANSIYIQDQDSFEEIMDAKIDEDGRVTCNICGFDGKYSEFIKNSNKKENKND